MIEFKMTGNWSVAQSELKNLAPRVRSAGAGAQRKIAQKIARLAKEHIMAQDLNWAPKSRESSNSRVLYDSGAYYHSIRSWKQGNTYYSGVPLGAVNHKGTPIILYALTHEFGSSARGIPARPLWRPVYKEVGGRKGIAQVVRAAILQKISVMKSRGFTL